MYIDPDYGVDVVRHDYRVLLRHRLTLTDLQLDVRAPSEAKAEVAVRVLFNIPNVDGSAWEVHVGSPVY